MYYGCMQDDMNLERNVTLQTVKLLSFYLKAVFIYCDNDVVTFTDFGLIRHIF